MEEDVEDRVDAQTHIGETLDEGEKVTILRLDGVGNCVEENEGDNQGERDLEGSTSLTTFSVSGTEHTKRS